MKNKMKAGFTLVEIMIVVAIIALLAAIAIPNLLRAKISSNDTTAQATLRTLSTAAESYGTANNGNYPGAEASLTGATPPYLNKSYCGTTASGYNFVCTFASASYTLIATPVTVGTSGSTTYTMRTGGILTP
jgi:prepilin-type N-terminal cleavage/methylation domain-containing protein